ncbi:glia maturation factor gamma [Toxorhynchites rutilus septentrionalis]|uniref:glia maturation factor gamma n=1 Tax=Toxorhynchites rutilus septentrionalis TaxID=329112 RepID=UPI0024792BBC|nr:glia maturation factor gamma [Toxorhynchites rutilus septentrionalis]
MTEAQICDISPEAKNEISKFRFRRNASNIALILKIDREKQLVTVDELLDDVTVEDLQEQLPSHQPRYIIYSYKMAHDDGRISYPMCFIFYTPRDSQMELCMLYAKTRMALQREADLTRYYEIRELDDMTEDWLKEKLR